MTIVLLIYGSINYYLYRRILHSASPDDFSSMIMRLGIIILVLSYPIGRIFAGSWVGDIFIWIGSFWLGAMFYGLLLGLIFDFVRLCDIPFGWIPDVLLRNIFLTRRIFLILSVLTVALLLWFGHLRSLKIITNKLEISSSKIQHNAEEYHVAAFADSHLGAIVGLERLNHIVDKVNEIDADICLIIGDLIDEPAERLSWVVEPLLRIKARDGIFIVLGNHEYYAGVAGFTKLANEAGFKLLRDSAYTIKNAVNIIGLDDDSGRKQFKNDRVSIQKIAENLDTNLPTILMHHTPSRMFEAQSQGVDLMISGHTHGGQIWPFNYITKIVFGVKQGLSRFGDMNFFLTNGVGTWGMPLRIGAEPEIVHFILKPEE